MRLILSSGMGRGSLLTAIGSRRKILGAIASGMAISLFPHGAFAAYSIKDIGLLSGDADAAGLGINNVGTIVGRSDSTGSQGVFYNSPSGPLTGLGTFSGAATANGTALAINSAGIAVGSADESDGTTSAFTANTLASASHTLNRLPAGTSIAGTTTTAYGINSAGVVVGESEYSTGSGTDITSPIATKWTGSGTSYTLTRLDPTSALGGSPDGASSVANGIDTAGNIVGQATNAVGQQDGFLYSAADSKYYDLGTVHSDDTSSTAEAISDRGVIIGNVIDATGNPHAVSLATTSTGGDLAPVGRFALLDPANVFTTSDAHAINFSGDIVGDATTGNGSNVGFLYAPDTGSIEDVNSLLPTGSGWDLLSADGINDSGQITGYGTYLGKQSIYLLTPGTSVPEPTAGTTFAIIGCAIFRRRPQQKQQR